MKEEYTKATNTIYLYFMYIKAMFVVGEHNLIIKIDKVFQVPKGQKPFGKEDGCP